MERVLLVIAVYAVLKLGAGGVLGYVVVLIFKEELIKSKCTCIKTAKSIVDSQKDYPGFLR